MKKRKEKIKNHFSISLMLGALFLFLSNYVKAMSDLFEPEAANTDYLIHKILMPYFGYGMGINYEENPFSGFTTVFLGGLLIVMGILLMFHTWQGLTNTSTTGESMGGKASLHWTAMRSVVGVGMLFPMGSSGLATIQHVILWLAAQGVLFADVAWESWINNPSSSSNTFVNTSVKSQIVENIQKIYLSELCVQAGAKFAPSTGVKEKMDYKWGMTSNSSSDLNKDSYINKPSTSYNVSNMVTTSNLKKDIVEIKYSYGITNNNSSLSDRELCGSIILKKETTENLVDNIIRKNTTSLNEVILQDIVDQRKLKNDIRDEHFKQMENVFVAVRPIVAFYLENQNKSNTEEVLLKIKNDVQKIVDDYITNVTRRINQSKMQNQNEDVIKAMKRDGIASAGAFYFQLATQQSSLSSVINELPSVTMNKNLLTESLSPKSNALLFKTRTDERLNEISPLITTALKDGRENLMKAISFVNVSNGGKINYSSNEDVTEDNVLSKFTEKFTKSSLDEVLHKGFNGYEDSSDDNDEVQNVHPLIAIHNFGIDLLATVSSILVAVLVLSVASGTLLSGATTLAVIFSGIFTGIMTALFVPAIMMAFYIPLIPFILWIGTLFGWIVMVVQALFGGPLWMITFLSPDKDGFVGRSGQGYMLILSLTMRPVLMVLGLISSFILVTPILRMVNDFYGVAYKSIEKYNNGSAIDSMISGIFNDIAFLVIYCVLINKTVLQVFALIHKIADELLTWIGGPGGSLGGYASQVEGGVSGSAATAMAAGNQLNNALIGAAQNAGHDHRNKMREGGIDLENLNKHSPMQEDLMESRKDLKQQRSELEKSRNDAVDKSDWDAQNEGKMADLAKNEQILEHKQNLMASKNALDALKRGKTNSLNMQGSGGFVGSANEMLRNESGYGGTNNKAQFQKIYDDSLKKLNELGVDGIKILTNDKGGIENPQQMINAINSQHGFTAQSSSPEVNDVSNPNSDRTTDKKKENMANKANTIKVSDDASKS